MRSFLNQLGFWAIFALGLATLGRALAATTSSLTLSGVINERSYVRIDQDSNGARRGLSSMPNEDIELAKIVEVNNTSGVFVVRISSLHHGTVQSGADSGPRYLLTYNAAPVDLAPASSIVSRGYRAAGTKTVHALNVRFDANSKVSSDKMTRSIYSDTLTFSVAAD